MDKLRFVHAVPMELQATLKVEASYFSSPIVPIYSSLKKKIIIIKQLFDRYLFDIAGKGRFGQPEQSRNAFCRLSGKQKTSFENGY